MSKWKSHLLSTGLPLEHEIYQMLAGRGFYVKPEYEYSRLSDGNDKDFSVDIDATFYSEHQTGIRYQINVLVECKYRSRDKSILLFEDPGQGIRATLGKTISCFDEADDRHWKMSEVYDLERSLPFVFGVLEVSDTGAHPNELKRGLNQLLYAAPEYILDHIKHGLDGYVDDLIPQVFMRFIVTNAPLRLVRQDVGLKKIEESENIEDISDEIEAAVVVLNSGPDFKNHVSRVIKKYDVIQAKADAERLQFHLERRGKIYRPRIDELSKFVEGVFGGNWELRDSCTQHFIVSKDNFERFLTKTMRSVSKAYNGRTKKSR